MPRMGGPEGARIDCEAGGPDTGVEVGVAGVAQAVTTIAPTSASTSGQGRRAAPESM